MVKPLNLFGVLDKFIDSKVNIIDQKIIYDDLIKVFRNVLIPDKERESDKLEKILVNIFEVYSNIDDIDKTIEYDNILCDKVEKYILDNIDNPITLEDISIEVKYNASYITKIFKKRLD